MAYTSYNIESRLVYDGDEIYIQTDQSCATNEEIAEQLSKTTFAHSAKGFPRKSPSRPGRSNKKFNKDADNKEVSKEELDGITNRLCKPTVATQTKQTSKNIKSEPDKEDTKTATDRPTRPPSKKKQPTQSADTRKTDNKKKKKGRVIRRRDGFEYSSDDESYLSDDSYQKPSENKSNEKPSKNKGTEGGSKKESHESDNEKENDGNSARDRTPDGRAHKRKNSRSSQLTSIPPTESTLSLNSEGSKDSGDSPRSESTDAESSRSITPTENRYDENTDGKGTKDKKQSAFSETSSVSKLSLSESEPSRANSTQSRTSSHVSYQMSNQPRKAPSIRNNSSFRHADGNPDDTWKPTGPGQSPRPSPKKQDNRRIVSPDRRHARDSQRKRTQDGPAPRPSSPGPSKSTKDSKTEKDSSSLSPRGGTSVGSRPSSSHSVYSQKSQSTISDPARASNAASSSTSPQRSLSHASMQSANMIYSPTRKSTTKATAKEVDSGQSGRRSRTSIDAFSNNQLRNSRESLSSPQPRRTESKPSRGVSPRSASVVSNHSRRSTKSDKSGRKNAPKKKQKAEFLRYIMDEYEDD